MKKVNPFLQNIITDPNIISLLNSIYDGIYIVNTEGEIVFWNKGAEKITGHLNEDILNHKCSDDILNHIDENGHLLCNKGCPISKSMKTGNTIEKKVYPLSKTKERFPVLSRVDPIKDEEGNIVGAIEVFRDISKEEDFRILQEKFNNLIKKYVSDTTYKEITKQALTGKTKTSKLSDLTLLFVDIADFTEFVENNSMCGIVSMLNEVFDMCGKIIKKQHGDIDKFIGDSLMAVFVDANDAVIAAQEIWKQNELQNIERDKNKKQKILLHYGINSGKVIWSDIGTSERKDLTVFGDAVNIAKRIEEMSDTNAIYISESTYARLKNPQIFTFHSKLTIKGKKDPIAIFKSFL